MKERITKKQSQVLEYVTEYIRENGYAPAYREIGEALGLSSTATVHEHVKNLEQKGYLSSGEGIARGLEVDSGHSHSVSGLALPLLGLITAGEPIEAIEGTETEDIPFSLVRNPSETFVLQVRGESMKDDGILSGDLVVVERNPSPPDGKVVVALLENEYATLKRMYREKGRVRLQPANSEMQPFFVKELQVQGVVRGVIRKMD